MFTVMTSLYDNVYSILQKKSTLDGTRMKVENDTLNNKLQL